ncbi:MAG: hypothetical protein WBG90_18450 [Saonia sp.]
MKPIILFILFFLSMDIVPPAKTVVELKTFFDTAYTDATTGANATSPNKNPIFGSLTSGSEQEYYRLADWLKALIGVWQATGDIT